MSVVSSIRLCFPFVVITEQRLVLHLPSRCISGVLMCLRSQLPVRHVSSLLTPPLTCFSVSLHPNCCGAFTRAADFISELSILGSLCTWSFLLLCRQRLTLEVGKVKERALVCRLKQLSGLFFTVHYCINSEWVPVDPWSYQQHPLNYFFTIFWKCIAQIEAGALFLQSGLKLAGWLFLYLWIQFYETNCLRDGVILQQACNKSDTSTTFKWKCWRSQSDGNLLSIHILHCSYSP